eukprot:CAMPEP_0113872058 /NCGR_PEP_ID=MMETSP0780_2-20120614/2990_1 /TAXON_ID=652834 /ORGANISM="Palpitomonas bilix" /LENGTH=485 /DNA_ID=CAMNT_0000857523 /DNA_START=77 /DNA_END=1534 /DNA_ORIENTATION=+ /assembly_acc=CAM_ASM_000599
MKAENEARQREEKKVQDRKRNLLVLVSRYLADSGYFESSDKVQSEAGVSLENFELADNIDLNLMYHDFEEFYEVKYGKKPKFVRKCTSSSKAQQQEEKRGKNSRGSSPSGRPPTLPKLEGKDEKKKKGDGNATPRSSKGGAGESDGLALDGKQIEAKKKKKGGQKEDEDEDFFRDRILKPLPDFESAELRELAAQVHRDIFVQNPNVRWEDVVGNDKAKRLLKEAVVMPIKYPQLFTGLLKPWRGILLYGPPGTGKTMLAKAVASECKTTFFNISASTIVSKWRGDSEKLVRMLFELARYYAPSTIFMDEIDSIMSTREGNAGEHEGSRRMKTEILLQMDGLAREADEKVFLLAASNLPWELDAAMLRRIDKRILVDLPNDRARLEILEKRLPPSSSSNLEYDAWSKKMDGYSGSDLALVCKEAAMRPLRSLMDDLEAGRIEDDKELSLRPVTNEDVHEALKCTRPSAKASKGKYEAWEKEFGST